MAQWLAVSDWHSVLGDNLIGYCFQQYKSRLGAGEVKSPAVGSAGNKLSGFRRLPTLNETLFTYIKRGSY